MLYINGVPYIRDAEHYKTVIDNSYTYFEALNMKTAKNRVKKCKDNKKELFNLKNRNGKISFF